MFNLSFILLHKKNLPIRQGCTTFWIHCNYCICACKSPFHHEGVVWIHCKEPLHINRKKILHFITLVFFSLLPTSPPDTTISTAALFILSLTSCCIQLAAAGTFASTLNYICKCDSSRLVDIISSDDHKGYMFVCKWVSISAIGWTYLSLQFQICFISYKDHRKFISVFYSKNLSLEFVDFFKAVKHITWHYVVFSAQTKLCNDFACRGIHLTKNEQCTAMSLNDTNKRTHHTEVEVITTVEEACQ